MMFNKYNIELQYMWESDVLGQLFIINCIWPSVCVNVYVLCMCVCVCWEGDSARGRDKLTFYDYWKEVYISLCGVWWPYI